MKQRVLKKKKGRRENACLSINRIFWKRNHASWDAPGAEARAGSSAAAAEPPGGRGFHGKPGSQQCRGLSGSPSDCPRREAGGAGETSIKCCLTFKSFWSGQSSWARLKHIHPLSWEECASKKKKKNHQGFRGCVLHTNAFNPRVQMRSPVHNGSTSCAP